MIVFTLDQITDKYSPQDLVPVTIEKIKNLNTNSYVPKYLIHVNGDTFGLFSGKYTYCSTKALVDKLPKFSLKKKVYENGILTVFLESKEQDLLDNIPDDVFKVISLLTEVDITLFESNVSTGIFICNSYTGSRRLSLGGTFVVRSKHDSFYIKTSLLNFDSTHIPTLPHKLETELETTKSLDIQSLQAVDSQIAESILIQKLNKKQKENYRAIFSQLPTYNFLHILTFVSFALPEVKQLDILKDLNKLITKEKEEL